jgi:hypothetical protein
MCIPAVGSDSKIPLRAVLRVGVPSVRLSPLATACESAFGFGADLHDWPFDIFSCRWGRDPIFRLDDPKQAKMRPPLRAAASQTDSAGRIATRRA